jgi:hypothetical protein
MAKNPAVPRVPPVVHRRLAELAEDSRQCEAAYKRGNKSALMRMIVICAIREWPNPKWAAEVIEGAHGFAACAMIGSWDEVFGKPNTKRKSWLRKFALRDEIYFRILELHDLEGRAIDDELFEQVAEEFKHQKIGGKTKIKELYAFSRDFWERVRKSNAGKNV